MDLITAKFENDVLTLYAHNRIDSNSAAEAESLINSFCEQYPTEQVVLDVEDLQYISSAGLRDVLRLKKMRPQMKIVGASTEIYELFEMTGFTEMITVEKAYRKVSVEGCEVIGRGAKGIVYRLNPEIVIKVYKNNDCLDEIRNERTLARKAFVLGIPTAISYDVVQVDGKYGSVFELLDAKSYSKLLLEHPEDMQKYIAEYAKLCRQIHETMLKPGELPDGKQLPEKWLRSSAPYLSEEDNAKLKKLVADLPDTLNMLHCDFHTNNIMMHGNETLLIDMDTLSQGHPVIELANVYITYVGFQETDPDNVARFLGIPAEQALKVWDLFLPVYLGTDDPARLKDVTDKAHLLSLCRLLHHTLKHLTDPEVIAKDTKYCAEKIHELLQRVDTLDF